MNAKTLRFFFLVLALTVFTARAVTPTIRFSTYLGGSGYDISTAIATGPDGSIYVTGLASSDFPHAQLLDNAGTGAFVAKLAPDGSTLTYATLIGGFFPRAIAVDSAGQVYLAGHTLYNGLLVKNAIQSDIAGGFDAVVMKLNAQGNQVLFSTFLGGNDDDTALAIALDGTGAIWISGLTTSTNFPVANQPFQSSLGGTIDAFLARLSADGSTLQYSTYFGAEGNTLASSIAFDSLNRPVLAGRTSSTALPMKNALQPTKGLGSDAFVAKFDATGRSLVFSTYLGGNGGDSGSSVALDALGNIYVYGTTSSPDFPTRAAAQTQLGGDEDMFIAKLLPDGSDLVYSTYLGGPFKDTFRGYPFYFGNAQTGLDIGGLAVTPAGRAMVVGTTGGPGIPLVNALRNHLESYTYDAVATLYEPNGTIAFSTLIGGDGSDLGFGVATTPDGGFALTGIAAPDKAPPDFPVTPGAFQLRNADTDADAFIVKIDTATPPLPNDNYANATVINGGPITLLAQTGAATKELNEPAHNGNAGGKSVWYRWTVPVTGRAEITTEGSNYPTLLAIYRSDVNSQYLPVTVNGPVDHDTYSEARFPVTQGDTYFIAVDGRDGASGLMMLSLNVSQPPNDDFADRQLITGDPATVTGSNIGSTGERSDVARSSVWWKWTPPTPGYYTITTIGSDFDTALAIYTGFDLVNLQRLDVQSSYTNNLARSTFHAEEAIEYEILVTGNNGEIGHIQLNIAPAVRPPNDDFATRTRLTERNELVTGTDFDAGLDIDERALQLRTGSPTSSGKVVWWEWTAPITGAAEISATGATLPSSAAATVSILVIPGDALPSPNPGVIQYYGTTSATTSNFVYVTDVQAGAHYQIGLDATDYDQPVEFTLKIRAIAPPRIIAGSLTIDADKIGAHVEGIEGHNYRVTASSDLKSWTNVTDFPAITGEFAFESPVGTGYRFFRVEEY